MDEQKNLIWAMILSAIVVMLYFTFVQPPEPASTDPDAAIAEQQAIEQANLPPVVIKPREEVIASGGGVRIKIDSPGITGSFLTTGSRLDDISLKRYNKTLDVEDGLVSLLNPEGSESAAYLTDNWTAIDGGSGAQTEWAVVSGDVLTPNTPVTLQSSVGPVRIERVLTVDENYLITLSDRLTNTGAQNFDLERKGISRQIGLPKGLTNFFIIQEGPISVVDGTYHELKYKKLRKKGGRTDTGTAGWVGLTDKYWIQSAIAPQGTNITAESGFRLINNSDVYETSYTTAATTLTPGATISSESYMFAGPKDYRLLKSYEDKNIADFTSAIGWGRLKILVKPISISLSWLGQNIGNFGLGILALTLIIRLLMFPLYNKQYGSMAKMKKVQPMMKKLQTRYKDDRMKLQQEMMALYKREKVNPAAGCLPMIPTIFVFFALYKAVFINIDLRHEGFAGYIQDLSAREPLSILNGFGLFPWDGIPPQGALVALLAIGPMAVLYAISMRLMYLLQPAPGAGASDQAQMQAKIFKWMPWIFMFVLAGFPAGLLLYWIWSNVLAFLQQYFITRKNGVDTPVDQFFRKITGKPDPIETTSTSSGDLLDIEPNQVKKKKKNTKKSDSSKKGKE